MQDLCNDRVHKFPPKHLLDTRVAGEKNEDVTQTVLVAVDAATDCHFCCVALYIQFLPDAFESLVYGARWTKALESRQKTAHLAISVNHHLAKLAVRALHLQH